MFREGKTMLLVKFTCNYVQTVASLCRYSSSTLNMCSFREKKCLSFHITIYYQLIINFINKICLAINLELNYFIYTNLLFVLKYYCVFKNLLMLSFHFILFMHVCCSFLVLVRFHYSNKIVKWPVIHTHYHNIYINLLVFVFVLYNNEQVRLLAYPCIVVSTPRHATSAAVDNGTVVATENACVQFENSKNKQKYYFMLPKRISNRWFTL